MATFNYTSIQEEIFFRNAKRFTVVSKGRRVGLTRGAAQAFMEYSLGSKQLRILWGETIYGNVQRYVDLYFMPTLTSLHKSVWEWKAKLLQLEINGTVIDFRSADSPETWEGFGYHIIFLNEAGIILRNPDLYRKTVLPMLMDYPDSRLIAAGVPKGKKLKNGDPHPFYELWDKAASHESYTRYKFSSYDNPFLSINDIKEIEEALDDRMKLQEIYGEFIDNTDNPYLYAFTQEHIVEAYEPSLKQPLYLSFDFNISPNSCVIGQQPDPYSLAIFDEISVNGSTEEVCKVVLSKYHHWIDRGLVFVVGDATGNNRHALSGELTNYIMIKKFLKLKDFQMKVKRVNNPLDSSRVICNAILTKGEVTLTKACKQTIIDCQVAAVDGGGNLIKESGLHKFDCFRYMLEAVFPDFLKAAHKYIRPATIPKPQPLTALQTRIINQTINKPINN